MDSLTQLTAHTTLFKGVSLVHRRRIACVLRTHLQQVGLKAFDAILTAAAVCHCDPEPWLTRTQTLAELRRVGITFRPERLYRLARKASKRPDGTIHRWINSNGNYVACGSISAVAHLIVRRIHGPVEFMLNQSTTTQKSKNCGGSPDSQNHV